MATRNKACDAAVYGVDLGKNVFHVVAIDATGNRSIADSHVKGALMARWLCARRLARIIYISVNETMYRLRHRFQRVRLTPLPSTRASHWASGGDAASHACLSRAPPLL